MVVNGSKKSLKVAKIFYCNFCDYNTSRNTDYEKHLATDKHKMVVNGSKKSLKVAEYKCDNIYNFELKAALSSKIDNIYSSNTDTSFR